METVDIDVALKRLDQDGNKIRLKDRYCYIAVFNGHSTDWQIIDYGTIQKGMAHFSKMGRNILYMAFGYNGKGLVPISDPFILEKNGSLRYIHMDRSSSRSIVIHRKYYQSENVVNMRRRILDGKIQCSDRADFKDAVTLYTIENTGIHDKIRINPERPYRYWRYMSADGSYGSIAELAFFDKDTVVISGSPLSSTNDVTVIHKAYDNDWLSNFETDSPDGNWIGIDAGKPVNISFVRIIPRSDDNDICPGNDYELFYWTGEQWQSLGFKTANDNCLHFDNVPDGALLWLRNYTRGWDERPFLIDPDGNVEWR